MRKLFKSTIFMATILTTLTGSSQVDIDNLILAKYADFYEYDSFQDDYIKQTDTSGWLDVKISPNVDYYIIEINNDGEEQKIWWEYTNEIIDGFEPDSFDVYYTEDGRKVIFNYSDQEIYFYYDYSEIHEQYLNFMALSKIETYEK